MRLGRAATIVSIYRALGLVGRAGAVLLLAKLLGPDAFGRYNTLIVAATIVASFGTFGTQHAHSYFLNAGRMTDAQALGNALLFSAAVTVLLGLVLSVAGQRITAFAELHTTPAVFTLLVAGLLLQGQLSAHLLARNRVHAFSMLTQGFNLIVLLLSGAVAFFMGLTLAAAIVIYAGVVFASALYGVVAVGRVARRLELGRETFRSVLRFGAAVVTGNVLLVLMYRLNYLLLGSLSDYADVGRYAVATTVAEVFLLLPQALGTVVFPKVSASDPEQAAAMAAKSVGVSLVLSLASVALGLVPALILIGPVFGVEYESARFTTVLLMPGVVGMCIAYVVFQYYSGIGRPGVPAKLLGAAVAVNIILNLVLIPAFGARGAAVAASVAYIVAGVGGAIVFRRDDPSSRYPLWQQPVREILSGLRSLRMTKPAA